ncbi:hypothetical protein Tel_04285 [Candidatus Tenderia electrophaga]|jgi:YegS/Rv2252/BmrU family lipid kinase|uniref:DAGKc domain-containing protein n=1 Tax=Candidatus Tenderia electrophaga TaxID=1748243 RepID=A0A0S2TB85_9GAMM|nr:hypothetical protein Tel_04285 [Candidatus Tenderia electrophaga]
MIADTLLVVNKKARKGQSDLCAGIDVLRQAGWRLREEYPAQPNEIPELIQRYGADMERIIIGGGDGTLNRAAEALIQCKRPVGLIPLGTANDLARTLSLRADIVPACVSLINGKLHEIDLGNVNGKHFFNVANIGVGVKVTQKISKQGKQRWGVLAYLRSLYLALKTRHPFELTLRVDGKEERVRSIHVAVGNGRHYGGGVTIMSDARIDTNSCICPV